MNGSNLHPWQVIRQEKNGSRYRIGRCATRSEAQRLIERLRAGRTEIPPSHSDVDYLVERVEAGGRGRR
ncbi:SPOR domain-containing protein [Streptomyces sp. DSM 44915]|uniref:SPOR domain-containing protein n=1 Tax=Streptomyces chisholmiae TaxID=3075540 RepID=A0ABU2JKA9_9ACTN|nr:SPOR domain-containing protein [Streptomyces sp. DSM 44915]MDT0265425.1 SPOR domain-containing protein [Streptomyces sp. DSM 44915]